MIDIDLTSAHPTGGSEVLTAPPETVGDPAIDSSLFDHGFARYDLAKILNVPEDDEWLRQLQDAFANLPPDPYLVGGSRYRRYARAVLLPWSTRLEWIPPIPDPIYGWTVEYYQGQFNPEFPGVVRAFPSITEEARNNPLLARLIQFDLTQTFWAGHERFLPLHVGIHFVQLAVHHEDEFAVSSPDCLHQDGERFTFAHCIVRRNVRGGVNTIARPEWADHKPQEIPARATLAQFELTTPLDSYAVHDPQVSHYVGAIRKANGTLAGERGVILIDFTPMAPVI